jgi:hypothetical protein
MATELLKAYVHNEAAIVTPGAGAHTLASAAGIGLPTPRCPLFLPLFLPLFTVSLLVRAGACAAGIRYVDR